MKRFRAALPIVFTTASLFAQRATPTVSPSYSPSAEDAAAAATGCVACGGCAGGGLVIMVVIGGSLIALSVALLVWVARDAKNRGMDNAVMWMILVFFTNVLGLIIYIFSRPQGNLVPCPSCKNKRLEASAKCPHCGNP
jgi:phospholipase D-like protein